MAVSFRFIGLRPRPEELGAAAVAFIEFAQGLVQHSALATPDGAVTRLPGGRRAAALHRNGRQTLIASSACEGLHAEEALLDLMRRCRWDDFRYIYVEREPCHGGAFSRPRGRGCKDRLAAALPSSDGVVFYARAQRRP